MQWYVLIKENSGLLVHLWFEWMWSSCFYYENHCNQMFPLTLSCNISEFCCCLFPTLNWLISCIDREHLSIFLRCYDCEQVLDILGVPSPHKCSNICWLDTYIRDLLACAKEVQLLNLFWSESNEWMFWLLKNLPHQLSLVQPLDPSWVNNWLKVQYDTHVNCEVQRLKTSLILDVTGSKACCVILYFH